MPSDEFWHGDMRLLEVYRKAYEKDKAYTTWLNGKFNHIAFGVVLSNALAKKGSTSQEYPKWEEINLNFDKPKINKEDVEKEYRLQQIEQQSWLFGR